MTDNNAKVLGLGTIIAMVLVFAVVVGALSGLYGDTLGLSAAARGGVIGGSVGALASILIRRRSKALGENRSK